MWAIANWGEFVRPVDSLTRSHRRGIAEFPIAFGLAILIYATLASAQTSPASSQDPNRRLKPAVPVATGPASAPAAPRLPPAPRTREQMPPAPPRVSWDGKQLSINCENSTLSDILKAVRARTGADIEIPPSAAAERIATSLGPAPAREVLASLLSSSNFDYIIQGSDKNQEGLGTITLTPRDKADGEVAPVGSPSSPVARRMPGYPGSGQRNGQTPRGTVADTSPPSEPATTGDTAEPTQEPVAESVDPAPVSLQPPVATDSPAAPPSPATATTGASPAGNDSAPAAQQPALPPAQDAGASQPSSVPPTAQDLQRMNQQRRDIQTQPNQTTPAPPN